MKNYNEKQVSKFISLVLRHKPEIANLTLDRNGWVETSVLLQKLNEEFSIGLAELEYIVENNNKKRFEFSNDKSKIRASQGHSVDVDLNYVERKPPTVLYHGTAAKNYKIISESGIKKMNRHAVHLSEHKTTAIEVGKRHGSPIIFVIESEKMYNDGIKFYKSTNNVWLTDFVDKKYIKPFTDIFTN
jgi:putative RNA 2'-phosphotransferase